MWRDALLLLLALPALANAAGGVAAYVTQTGECGPNPPQVRYGLQALALRRGGAARAPAADHAAATDAARAFPFTLQGVTACTTLQASASERVGTGARIQALQLLSTWPWPLRAHLCAWPHMDSAPLCTVRV